MQYKKDSIPEILASIDLAEYAYDRGYTQMDKTRSTKNSLVLKHPATGDKILISRGTRVGKKYSNVGGHNDDDFGNIINFAKNRLVEGVVSSESMASKGDTSKAIKILREHMGQVVETPRVFKEFKSKRSESYDVNQMIKNLTDLTPAGKAHLIKDRGIDNRTIDNPIFAGTIVTARTTMPNKHVIHNTAFIKKHFETRKVEGFTAQYRSTKEKQNKKLVFAKTPIPWTTNIQENTDKLFIGESEVDCLSHFQLKKPQNAMYLSSGGQFTTQTIDYALDLEKHLKEQGKTVDSHLITDNDRSGYNYDLKYLIQKHNRENPLSIIEVKKDSNEIKLFHHTNLSVDISTLQNDVKNEMAREMGTTRHGKIVSAVQMKDIVVIQIPATQDNCYKYLSHISDYVNRNLRNPMVIHKPSSKDWNDELKGKTHKNDNPLNKVKEIRSLGNVHKM